MFRCHLDFIVSLIAHLRKRSCAVAQGLACGHFHRWGLDSQVGLWFHILRFPVQILSLWPVSCSLPLAVSTLPVAPPTPRALGGTLPSAWRVVAPELCMIGFLSTLWVQLTCHLFKKTFADYTLQSRTLRLLPHTHLLFLVPAIS